MKNDLNVWESGEIISPITISHCQDKFALYYLIIYLHKIRDNN